MASASTLPRNGRAAFGGASSIPKQNYQVLLGDRKLRVTGLKFESAMHLHRCSASATISLDNGRQPPAVGRSKSVAHFPEFGTITELSCPPPSPLAIEVARRLYDSLVLFQLPPTRVAVSVVGGIGLTIRNRDRKAYIEVYNDGTTYILLSSRPQAPVVFPWRTDSERDISRLHGILTEYLHA